ncbi:MAG: tyrosine--tRNA ligase [Leptospiraceae bacterium]|nr:tyrosine--tRNA ligase [Leptospiraceae bacterium]
MASKKKSGGAKPKTTIAKETRDALALIKRGAVDVLPEEELISKLERSRQTGKPLVIKAGFDPTAPDLHLGHIVLLRKLKHFQELGHEVHFLIGDFTGMIGDPTGRSETRVRLTREAVEANAETYKQQVFRILDPQRTKIVFNSSWCRDMRFEDVLGLTARYTVARLLERDDFMKRYKSGESISLIEFMYPLVQGYDSVAMHSDVELGGTDQKFNLLVGRELQKEYGQEPQVIVTTPLLVGLDGSRKMSKSYDNYVAINDAPFAMFAKIMSISDELMWDYFVLLTDEPEANFETLRKDPLETKKYLAQLIVADLYSTAEGKTARSQWDEQKTSRTKMVLPPDTPEHTVDAGIQPEALLVDVFVDAGIESSKGAVRRLIQSGAIKLGENLETIEDAYYRLSFPGDYVFKIGKKRYLKITGR